jgi:hypothetical protein
VISVYSVVWISLLTRSEQLQGYCTLTPCCHFSRRAVEFPRRAVIFHAVLSFSTPCCHFSRRAVIFYAVLSSFHAVLSSFHAVLSLFNAKSAAMMLSRYRSLVWVYGTRVARIGRIFRPKTSEVFETSEVFSWL